MGLLLTVRQLLLVRHAMNGDEFIIVIAALKGRILER